MEYDIQIKHKALKDLDRIPKEYQEQIVKKVHHLKPNLSGDVKRLTNFSPAI